LADGFDLALADSLVAFRARFFGTDFLFAVLFVLLFAAFLVPRFAVFFTAPRLRRGG
jgi:hypothetical protein